MNSRSVPLCLPILGGNPHIFHVRYRACTRRRSPDGRSIAAGVCRFSLSPRRGIPTGSSTAQLDADSPAASNDPCNSFQGSLALFCAAVVMTWCVCLFGLTGGCDAAVTSGSAKRQGLLLLSEITLPGFKEQPKSYRDPLFGSLEDFLKTRPKGSEKVDKQKAGDAKVKLEKEKAAAAEAKAKAEREKAAAEAKAKAEREKAAAEAKAKAEREKAAAEAKAKAEREKAAAEAKAKAEREKAAAEAKAKAAKERAAAEAKAKAERERKEREKKARERMQQQALLGGGAVGLGWYAFLQWNAVVPVFAGLFRAIGGPSLVSTLLKTPGYIVGRRVHLVQWNVEKSPSVPDGPVVTIVLRSQSPEGLKAAIIKSYGLTNQNRVCQMSHWLNFGPGFFEPINQASDFASLPDPVWVVWSKERGIGHTAIPLRSDAHPHRIPLADSIEEMSALVKLIHTVAKLSRQPDRAPGGMSAPVNRAVSDSVTPGIRSTPTPDEGCPDPSVSDRDVVERVMADAFFSESKSNRESEGKAAPHPHVDVEESSSPSHTYGANSDVTDRLLDDIPLDEPRNSASGAGRPLPTDESLSDGGASLSPSSAGDGADDAATSSIKGLGSEREEERGGQGLNLQPLRHAFAELRNSVVQFGKWGGGLQSESIGEALSSTDSEFSDSDSISSRMGFNVDGSFGLPGLPPSDFQVISEKEETDLVLMAAERDPQLLELFRVFVSKDGDVWSFFKFARELARRSRK